MAMRVKPDTGEVGLKQQYRVTNWSEYDRALVNRGNLTIWFDDENIRDHWTPPPPVWRGTPAQRLEVLRKTAIRKVFTSTFRQPAHGETKVVLTDDPAKVGVTQTPYDDWNVYAKSYRHAPARCLDTVVTVRLRWRTRVERRGLAVLNGMMTLDAILVGVEANDVRLLYATWAAQGRGNSINVVNGFIAISNGVSYHADTAERTLLGLWRKVRSATWKPSCT